jgi:hypothetical protein
MNKNQINGIAYINQNEIKLISFFTEKLVFFDLKSQKKLDDVRKRFNKKNLLLCNFTEGQGHVNVNPIHFVQLNTGNNSFDVGKLTLDEIVSLAYKGAIILTQQLKEIDELVDSPDDEIESGFDALFQ